MAWYEYKTKYEAYEAVLRELIYHGRYFSSKRDNIVVKKCLNRVLQIENASINDVISQNLAKNFDLNKKMGGE